MFFGGLDVPRKSAKNTLCTYCFHTASNTSPKLLATLRRSSCSGSGSCGTTGTWRLGGDVSAEVVKRLSDRKLYKKSKGLGPICSVWNNLLIRGRFHQTPSGCHSNKLEQDTVLAKVMLHYNAMQWNRQWLFETRYISFTDSFHALSVYIGFDHALPFATVDLSQNPRPGFGRCEAKKSNGTAPFKVYVYDEDWEGLRLGSMGWSCSVCLAGIR